MGRKGPGIEIRGGTSIRFTFLEGKPTWKENGIPVLPTVPNIRRALQKAADFREMIRHGTFNMAEHFPASGIPASELTLAVHLDSWIGTLRLADSTLDGYRSIVKFWKDTRFEESPRLLGDVAIRALKPSDIKGAIAKTKLSGKTVNNRVSVLREALESAVVDKILLSNPADTLKSARWQQREVDPFSADEAEKVIAAMPAGHVRNYTEFKFYTGLRSGESFGLRWANVDLAEARILVSESVVAGKEKSSTKTDTSRIVLLNSRALAAIKAQKELTYLEGGHVFRDPRDGKRWKGEPKFRFFWVGTLKRLGMRHRPQYNTRHTYATMMLMAGMTPAFCAKQLGHSIEVFLRTYSRWLDGAQDSIEMQRFERLHGSGDTPQVLPRD